MIGSGLPSPTKAESRRMDLIPEAGCICCWFYASFGVMAEVHHLLVGGHHGQLRRGHAFTVGLCAWHHRGVPTSDVLRATGCSSASMLALEVGPSFALEPNRFRQVFGGDENLMRLQSRRLASEAGTYLIRPVYADPEAA